jgi:pyrroloquinoline-quinone synthase
VLANCTDRAERRRWIERILDHDGRGDFGGSSAGGIEAWSRLGEAVGLGSEDLWSHRHVQAGVRFAVDAYVNFARSRPWEEAVISSLTEMFAPKIHADRLAGWPTLYPWTEAQGLGYFRQRIPLATRDVEHGLEVARRWCSPRTRQERALAILQFKLDILWSMLDAIERAYPDDLPVESRP